MHHPRTPRLHTIALPSSGVSPALPGRCGTDGHRRPPTAPGPSVHAALEHGVLYYPATRAFTTPTDGRRLASAILDAPAARPPIHQRTAVVSFASLPTQMFISRPETHAYVSIRDVLDAIDAALQHSHQARSMVVRVQVQSPSAGDYRVSLFQHPAGP